MTDFSLSRLFAPVAAVLVLAVAPVHAETADQGRDTTMRPSEAWDEMRGDVLGPGEIRDGAGLFTLDAPFRAEDAATVPVHIVQKPGTPRIAKLTLVVDENPSPVVATFTFGPAMDPLDLETRIRVNAYSNVRAIAETEDGALLMTGRYVRAAGGCSAPASKDATAALAALGQMKTRWYSEEPAAVGTRREAQVMLRHPNYSGLQRNQVTHLFVPARFIDTLEVSQGPDLLFRMEGGISISEDPTFRFRYVDGGGDESLSVRAHDTDGQAFEGSFPLGS
ncbi:quinoprotein dehydrogenase-associated SoxYZ-like carrier [Amaricoccus solimangrovi]|uniref:Quinoprotein dehydrogenase-associated SoxYZ-like carrier n=1 Tax=Amaricoccus solimangrovi TaxID=2589815 RepID=A0A501X0E8_9RHOB|nr:quinoprotein dehydrogenase-associated SoxYZ-like carrier [Amaricoccus solimangrovi]TPE52146.1 quinoprotein dehydrogenase-associated SoxYZ-like carrier [Amaricoccus solimangrovi]